MVNSILVEDIHYSESELLDRNDEGRNVCQYTTYFEDLDINVTIALGSLRDNYKKQGVVYFPIYLIRNKKVSSQIGVYEYKVDLENPDTEFLLDREKDVNPKFLDNPLLYSFVDKEYIINKTGKITKEKYVPKVPQTKERARKEEKEYKSGIHSLWVQKAFKNPKFDIIETKSNGDCLFDAVSIALKMIGINEPVENLRKYVAKNVTKENFENYSIIYNAFTEEISKLKSDVKQLKRNISERKGYEFGNDIELDKKFKIELEQIQNTYNKSKRELKVAEEHLIDYQFIKEAKNDFKRFQKILLTTSYWADEIALEILERKLNIKILNISQERHRSGSKNYININTHNANTETFNPDYYIMVAHDGRHYRLITYENNGALQYSEIPFRVKLMASEFLKGGDSIISMIPDFVKEFGIDREGKGIEIDEISDMELTSDLYNDSIVLVIGSRYINKFPGFENNESLGNENPVNFISLAANKDWRKMLSDSYSSKFTLNERTWLTVEHYINACKFINNNRKYYEEFALESNSDLSKDVNLAIAAGSLTGTYLNKLVRPKEIGIDRSFNNKVLQEVKERALSSKFDANKVLKNILIGTNNAKLIKPNMEGEFKTCYELMKLRKEYLNENNKTD